MARDDYSLNLTGTFANFAEFGVAQEPFNFEFASVAIAPVDLKCVIAYTCGNFASQQFRGRCFERIGPILIA